MAPGCAHSFYRNPGVSFHRLPASEFRLRQWLQAMKRKDVPDTKFARVCGDHFEDSDYSYKGSFNTDGSFENKKTNQLKNGACPSVFDFSSYTHKGGLMTDCPSTSVQSRERGLRKEKRDESKVGLFESKH